ncbi:MAG: squalene--hopene cyclase [Candidatus Methylomirabilota bacterium]|nr:MAG: squalene--hopene cyclase [candidate division NC10 bacterium]
MATSSNRNQQLETAADTLRADRSPLDKAIDQARARLLAMQDPAGFWVAELEADTTLTSEYIMLRYLLGKVDATKQRKAAAYLRETQLPDGGWNIYYGGPSHLSTTVKAYFALKLCGYAQTEPFMQRARELILRQGGLFHANVFTKFALAIFGQLDWRGVPAMPVEPFLLPERSFFNMHEISYWSRTVLTPLMIIFAHKPVIPVPTGADLMELRTEPAPKHDYRFPKDHRLVSWQNLFLAVDRLLHWYERRPNQRLRQLAIERATNWMLRRMGEGGLGGIFPAMANSVIALRCLGYEVEHSVVAGAFKQIEALEVEDERTLHLQPCLSPVWDTCLAVNALLTSGLPVDHPVLVGACQWLLSRQTQTVGDWKVKAPDAEPGGWYFQFENEFYPDIDDSAVVMTALIKTVLPDQATKEAAIRQALKWVLPLQSSDGGWAAYDKDNNKRFLNEHPFADHKALLDPPTADLTGRVLEMLGHLGWSNATSVAQRAIAFLKREQEPEGCWYGRWGVNYLYGTWAVLAGLRGIGEQMDQPYIRRAVDWLIGHQNPDGGWGESCHSYEDPRTAGQGPSTASQTAWALLGLLHAGVVRHPSVEKGIDYLLRTQGADGGWEEREFTGTGFPRVFYLRYHLYRLYFPLWALSLYRTLLQKAASGHNDNGAPPSD